MSDIDDLLRQINPQRRSDDADLRFALQKLSDCFWASKNCAPGNKAYEAEYWDIIISFLRDWDA